MDDIKKVFSIHFPGKQVYVNSTFKTLEEKIEEIKNDKDHIYYVRKISKSRNSRRRLY